MPYDKFNRDDTWYVHRIDADGAPVGKALGTHDDADNADAQIAALDNAYANESDDPTTKGDTSSAGSLGFGVPDDQAKKSSRVLVKSTQTEGTIEAVLYRVRDDDGNVTVCEANEIDHLAKPAVKASPVNVIVRLKFLLAKAGAGQPILRSDITYVRSLMADAIDRMGLGGRIAFALAQRKIVNAYEILGRAPDKTAPDVQRQVRELLTEALTPLLSTVPPAYRSATKSESADITRRKMLVALRNQIDLARRRIRQEPNLMARASVTAKIASENQAFGESASIALRRIASKIEAAMLVASKDVAKAVALLQSAIDLSNVVGGVSDSFVTVASMTPRAKSAAAHFVEMVTPLTSNAMKTATDIAGVYDALEELESELVDTPEADAALKALQSTVYSGDTDDAKQWAAMILDKARPFTSGAE